MMGLKNVFLASAALVLTLCSAGSPAQGADSAIGEQIAARECVGCHGAEIARGVTIQGVYVPSFREVANRPNQSRERLKSFVMIPRHPMPGLPLQGDEINHLVEYVYSLRN